MSHTILLIDDSSIIRSVFRSGLEREGFTVLEAGDGEEALAVLDGRAVSAVVCDICMPNMDGLAFLRRLRSVERYRFTPLLVLSTESRAEMKQAMKDAGAQAFITKPCPPSRIADAVKRFCP
jgi:two-component system, chemotaxis family, chemotaxis protein CheY